MLGRRLAEHLLPALQNWDQSRRQKRQDGIAAEERTRSQSRQAEMDRIALEDRARNQQRQTEQDEIQRMALMSAFSRDGIVPEGERETLSGTLPAMGRIGETPRPGTSVNTGLVDPSRYSQVGTVGGQNFYRDKAQQIAQQREIERQRRLDEALKMSQVNENNANAYSRLNPEPRQTPPVSWQTVETADGFVQVNPQTGERRPLGGMRPKPRDEGTPRPADFEKKAAFLIEGAEEANKALSTYRPTARSLVSKVPLLGNYGMSSEEQTAMQAAATLHDAYLRLTTGATISQSELDAAARQYVPQPGDGPDVIRAKAVRRAQIIRAIRAAAQPALAQQQRMAGGSDYDVPNPRD